MTLREVERLTVANACYALVSGRFADMINRENRGRAFDWADFADDMAVRCEMEIFLYIETYGWPEEKIQTLKATAREFGQEISTTLVSRAGLSE